MNKRVAFNVRGTKYETLVATLQRYPATLLGELSNKPASDREIVLDCSTLGFEAVLFFYQSNGVLSCPPDLHILHFEKLCRYFKLPERVLQKMKFKEGYLCYDQNAPKFRSHHQKNLWEFLEKPFKRKVSTIFSYFILAIIMFSVAVSCIATTKFVVRDSTGDNVTELTRSPTRDVTGDIVRHINEDIASEATRSSTKDITEDIARNITGDIARNSTGDIARKNTGDIARNSTGDIARNIS